MASEIREWSVPAPARALLWWPAISFVLVVVAPGRRDRRDHPRGGGAGTGRRGAARAGPTAAAAVAASPPTMEFPTMEMPPGAG